MKRETQERQKQVVFLGEARFPFGFASVQRMTLMAKAFMHVGIKATILCRKGSWDQGTHPEFPWRGTYEGIDYIYTSKKVHKPKGFIKRNLQKIKGVLGEYRYLKELKNEKGIDMAILSNRKLVHVIRYLFFSKVFDFPVVVNMVEMASAMNHKKSAITRLNDFLLDKWVVKFYDGALPISDTLQDYYINSTSNKPQMKLPIICDFKKFEVERTMTEKYFLYCGSIFYKEVIEFILESYRNLAHETDFKLYMIVSGESKAQVLSYQNEINSSFPNAPIKLFSNIPYGELVELYVNAKALLIPLRPTLQDASRFPHKIGEYLASGNPVVTTAVGEINRYFTDGVNALVADSYDINKFAQKLKFVVDNEKQAFAIGLNGKKMGFEEFDYRSHGKRLNNFIEKI